MAEDLTSSILEGQRELPDRRLPQLRADRLRDAGHLHQHRELLCRRLQNLAGREIPGAGVVDRRGEGLKDKKAHEETLLGLELILLDEIGRRVGFYGGRVGATPVSASSPVVG